jgi:DNA-binding transcriptional LysR family regulator
MSAAMQPSSEAARKSRIDLEQLKTFLEIARSNSFSRAARIRNRSQPAVSAQIRVLEEELNTALFLRSRNCISLTPAGAVFLRYAEEILELHWRAQDEIAKLRRSGAEV